MEPTCKLTSSKARWRWESASGEVQDTGADWPEWSGTKIFPCQNEWERGGMWK